MVYSPSGIVEGKEKDQEEEDQEEEGLVDQPAGADVSVFDMRFVCLSRWSLLASITSNISF
jgi:hypothetical protein